MQLIPIDKFKSTLLAILLLGTLFPCVSFSDRQRRGDTTPPQKQEVQHLKNNRSGFTFGSENFSGSQTIIGGNYLYMEYGYTLFPAFEASCKFSVSIVPAPLDDKLLSLNLSIYYLELQPALNFLLTASYLYNFKFLMADYGNIGLDFCFIASGPLEENIDFKVLPLGIFFNLKNYNFALRYELIKITFRF